MIRIQSCVRGYLVRSRVKSAVKLSKLNEDDSVSNLEEIDFKLEDFNNETIDYFDIEDNTIIQNFEKNTKQEINHIVLKDSHECIDVENEWGIKTQTTLEALYKKQKKFNRQKNKSILKQKLKDPMVNIY